MSKAKSTSLSTPDSVIINLYDEWHCFYFIDSLEAQRKQIKDCTYNCLDYDTTTFVFVQINKISKSRFVDIFGKSYLMINFIFCKDHGYFFGDTKILQFIFSEPSDEIKKSVNKLPQKKL